MGLVYDDDLESLYDRTPLRLRDWAVAIAIFCLFPVVASAAINWMVP